MHYSGIEPCDVLNGTGFRTVIWVSGCSIGCKGCFNPSTHNPNYGKEYTQETQKYLLECLFKDYIDGITITGGNPLESYNLDSVLSLVKEIHNLFPEKTIWLYSGYTWNDIWCSEAALQADYGLDYCENVSINHKKRQQIVSLCDVFIDGEYIDEQRDITLKWRGSSNQRVIDAKKSLKENKVILYCD